MTLYRDLIHFEPIVDVKVLTHANAFDQAREDVRTFVVSDVMRDALRKVLVPHLRFDAPGDHKALMVVATYGTGKTHLMSMVSAVAERTEFLADVTNAELRESLTPIAGKFKVIRSEIGSTRMSLRDIVCVHLEEGLAALGVRYKFKSADQTPGNKSLLVEMMQAFEAVYPEHGLLLVLDELLDYLRTRKDLELTLDLTFLREIGEVCRGTRFRFITGVQESLFDSPRFANMSAELIRVRDRYEQLRISREDVSFVVQERLLKKTVTQRDQIESHLRPFTPAFEGMAEHLAEFVSLFPVHPAYLRTFERITLVEKRKVLSTLSMAIEDLLDSELPSDQPGLICYDSYRRDLDADHSNRTIPEVREVLDKVGVLRARVEKTLSTKVYVPTALRIIDGLGVHRLTTADIHSPIGATAEELRDDLCLLPAGLPERDALFVRVSVEAIIDEIIRAVSGQFITQNPDNGQVYIDVRKDIDYDQKIDERASPLDEGRLDEAYFAALEEVLEQRDAPYVSGYRIWAYELPWAAKNVGRMGYAFFGAPNERSTAQPPRDFYVYFLQPYDPPEFTDERRPDEVFFRLDTPDDDFKTALRRYAGANALAKESTEAHRTVYEDKRNAARDAMVAWLKRNMTTAVSVIHNGVSQPVGAWLPGTSGGPRRSVKEQVDAIAAEALRHHFEARYPNYPKFAVNVTQSNLGETVKQAINQVATRRQSVAGGRVLASLGLVDLESNLIDTGPFAANLLQQLAAADGKAVNRSDLLASRDPGVETWGPWHLEPEWLVVTAAVCCQLGRVDLGYPTVQIDATSLHRLTSMNQEDLTSLSHVAPPKPTPVAALRAVAKLLGLGTATVPNFGADEELVRQVHTAGKPLRERIVQARSVVANGVQLWGALVVDRQAERDAHLEALQQLLDNVLARDSVGKLNKLDAEPTTLAAAGAGLDELNWITRALASRDRLSPPAEYIRQAVDVFNSEDDLADEAGKLRAEMLALFAEPPPIDLANVTSLTSHADRLRKRFADEAARAHARDRLDAEGDERKRHIIEGDLYKDLKAMRAVDLLPDGMFGAIETELVNIGSCKNFDEAKLAASVICPECHYRPHKAAGPTARARVDDIASRLLELHSTWQETLLDSLSSLEIAEQIALLGETEMKAVADFLHRRALPQPITEPLIRGVNQALKRFVVRRVSSRELWAAVFPAAQPSTLAELRARFADFLRRVEDGSDPERVRVLPSEENPS
ncbi:MAG TPA: DUF6079 family protein [Candidatus Dormibacteraeota bacterium]|nr:DUF6079 family protein [Candidatus Dormibacteraeota bacterium]